MDIKTSGLSAGVRPNRLGRNRIFSSIVVITYLVCTVIIFVVFTRICFSIHDRYSLTTVRQPLDVTFSVVQLDPGALSPVQELLKASADSFIGLLSPRLLNLPGAITQPLFVQSTVVVPTAYSRSAEVVLQQAAMVPTPHVMYAPAPMMEHRLAAPGGTSRSVVPHTLQQFRYREELGKKKACEVRVFVTGGSVAWGTNAPDEDSTIAAFLETELKQIFSAENHLEIKVVNAAAGGWTTTDERIWIQNRITEFEPDVIVSYSGYNDIYNLVAAGADLFMNFHNESAYYYWGFREYDKYNRGVAAVALNDRAPKSFFGESDFPRKTLKNIQITSSYLTAIGVPYVYVLQPVNPAVHPRIFLSMYEHLKTALREAQATIPFLFVDHSDLLAGRNELFTDGCHFGDIGYRIIARDLAVVLTPIVRKNMRCW